MLNGRVSLLVCPWLFLIPASQCSLLSGNSQLYCGRIGPNPSHFSFQAKSLVFLPSGALLLPGSCAARLGSPDGKFLSMKCKKRVPFVAAVLMLEFLLFGCAGTSISGSATGSSSRSYTTAFSSPPAPEDPISEQGNWINGQVNGLDWTNVQTAAGFASGTQSGGGGFDDSTAILKGDWKSDQSAQAVIHVVAQDPGVNAEESEIRLRSWMTNTPCPGQPTGGCNTGYEINFSAVPGNNYVQIVRWDGPLGSFTILATASPTVNDGSVVKATVTGDTISAFINGVQVLQATDATYNAAYCSAHPCNPGIGFFLDNGSATGDNTHFGFSSFTASD